MSFEKLGNRFEFVGLNKAWQHVYENSGDSPGVDGHTAKTYCKGGILIKLLELGTDLQQGKYVHAPLRYGKLKKSSGGFRVLKLPIIRDRIVQRLVATWLTDVVESRLPDYSFAYRRDRSQNLAAQHAAALIGEGNQFAVHADIKSCFDNLPTWPILRDIREIDPDALPVVKQCLAPGAKQMQERGVPQGPAISPVISNMILARVDRKIEDMGVKVVRFSDNYLVLGRSNWEVSQATNTLQKVLWETLRLALKPGWRVVDLDTQEAEFLSYAVSCRGFRPSETFMRRIPDQLAKFNGWYEDKKDALADVVRNYVRSLVKYFDGSYDVTWLARVKDAVENIVPTRVPPSTWRHRALAGVVLPTGQRRSSAPNSGQAPAGGARDFRDPRVGQVDGTDERFQALTFSVPESAAQLIFEALKTAQRLSGSKSPGYGITLMALEFNATYAPTTPREAAMHNLAMRFQEAYPGLRVILYHPDKGYIMGGEVMERLLKENGIEE